MTDSDVKIARRIVVEVYATAHQADLARQTFEQVAEHLNATARYHHRHSAPCCVQGPLSAFSNGDA